MAILDIVSDLITNLGGKWDNTNIADSGGNDATFCRENDYNQQTSAIYTNGVIALGNAEYNGIRMNTGFRSEVYTVPITHIKYMRSRAGFIDTIQELDRACNDYNDDGNGIYYFVRGLVIPSNDNLLEIEGDSGAYIEVYRPLVSVTV